MISCLSCSISFAAITYTATRAVGTGIANISITTDGTIGVIATANIIGWNIAISDSTDAFTLLGPISGGNSGVRVTGSDLTASATDLRFNFDSGSFVSYLTIQSPDVGTDGHFYAVQTNGNFDGNGPAEVIDPRTHFDTIDRSPRSGNMVIASVVPEPSSLALCMLGALGVWIRRR